MTMPDKVIFGKPKGFFDTFERRPGPLKQSMHYCPGCGHGTLLKLIAEAVADFELQDDSVFVCPVGCSVLNYYYMDMASISVPHGRAPAAATGITRSKPKTHCIVYQGDGDLGSIGLNNFLQAANRGENITVFFVNNAIYGMTGGQMAPTTLTGQVTKTCPNGRNPLSDGLPMKIAEMVSTLELPVYVERVALNNIKNVRAARKAVRKGLTYMKENRGFSLIEVVTACPTNIKLSPVEADKWVEEKMLPYFPLGCLKDVGATREPVVRPEPVFEPEAVAELLFSELEGAAAPAKKASLPMDELKLRFAGFGGQGVLSLGLMAAKAANSCGLQCSWLPSYGPEMRGGTANCSVVASEGAIGSPFADVCDILVVMNQPSLDKFAPDLKPDGLLFYDSSTLAAGPAADGKRIFPIKASDIANELGSSRCANSVLLGAISAKTPYLDPKAFAAAIEDSFKGKPKIVEMNLKAFEAGRKSVA